MENFIGAGEAIGYVASGLVFLAFCMKTMMPLRLMAIASNIAFIAYGAANGLVPIIVLHTLLLPMNAVRTGQIWQLVRRTRASQITELNIEDLLPHMTEERYRSGDMIFHKGDLSAKLFYLSEGRVHIQEIDVVLESGSLFGEMSLFSNDKTRTASAACLTDCRICSISEEQVQLLYFQNPRFGYYVIQLVVRRLIENVRRLEAENSALVLSRDKR